jgi:hypothetical protein
MSTYRYRSLLGCDGVDHVGLDLDPFVGGMRSLDSTFRGDSRLSLQIVQVVALRR